MRGYQGDTWKYTSKNQTKHNSVEGKKWSLKDKEILSRKRASCYERVDDKK